MKETLLTHGLETLERKRQELIDRILSALHELATNLRDDKDGCSFDCRSMLLGALIKQMHSRGLHSPRPIEPFLGFSFDSIVKSVSEMSSPDSYHGQHSYDSCTLQQFVHPIINSLRENLAKFTLGDF
jgi:hypothetical protein